MTIPDLTFPPGYFERARDHIKQRIEDNWEAWSTSKRRYLLISLRCVCDDDVTKASGTVTERMEFHVYSDSLDHLCQLWKTLQSVLDTTAAHYILDTHERKVVALLSICA